MDKKQIAIDGTCNWRSHDRASGKKAMHMVSAYATQSGLVLACLEVGEKSNEILPFLKCWNNLSLRTPSSPWTPWAGQGTDGAVDSDQGADYVLALKGNQGCTHTEVKELFAQIEGHEREFHDVKVTTFRQSGSGHGREETREYFLATRIDRFTSAEEWPGFYGVGQGAQYA